MMNMVNDYSLEEAIEKLNDDDVNIRKEAVNSLVGVSDESAIEPLINATTDENTPVRFKAAEILGTMGDLAVDKLINKFESVTGQNKRFIAFALKQTNSPKVIPSLVSAVEDDDFGVRKVAVRGLGELKAHDEIDAICMGLNDEDWGVRLAAVYGLGDLATPESVALIKKARRKEKDKDFKKSCNKTIKKAEKIIKAGGKLKPASKGKPIKDIKALEKENVHEAIKEYEIHVKEENTSPVPYQRLCILYKKLNDEENELRLLNTAIETLSKVNPGKEDWFQKRLSKKN